LRGEGQTALEREENGDEVKRVPKAVHCWRILSWDSFVFRKIEFSTFFNTGCPNKM
jgi:hypothetical protein